MRKNTKEEWLDDIANCEPREVLNTIPEQIEAGLWDPFKSLELQEQEFLDKLRDADIIGFASFTPFEVAEWAKVYAEGVAEEKWRIDSRLQEAIQHAFYSSFYSLPIVNKSAMVALNVSSDMAAPIPGTKLLCCEAAGIIAMHIARTATDYAITGFMKDGLKALPIGPGSNFKDAMDVLYSNEVRDKAGDVCPAMPMTDALYRKVDGIDEFVIVTDVAPEYNEQESQALRDYGDGESVLRIFTLKSEFDYELMNAFEEKQCLKA